MSKNLKNKTTTSNATKSAVQTIINHAATLIANKEVDQAIGLLEDAAKNHPDNPQLPYLIGKYLIENKSAADGIKKLEDNLEYFPEHVNTLLELGRVHLKPGNIRKANPYFLKALEIAPQNPSTQFSLGTLTQRKGDLSLAVEHYRKAIELQLKHPISDTTPSEKEDFKIAEAEQLLWDTLIMLTKNGIHVFMAFGSLLGIERNGELLLHDKDVDVGLPHSELDRAMRLLQHHGWQEVNNSFGYMSPRAVFHKETEFSMDLFSFLIDSETKKALCIGAGIPNIPKEWNILWEFDEIELEKRPTPNQKDQVWYLKSPEKWLDTIYGDWRTPDKSFDTMVSAKNLRSFSLLAQCFTYSRIFEQWTKNNIPRALSLTRTALHYQPTDGLMKKILARLESRRK